MKFLHVFIQRNFRILDSQAYITRGALELLCGDLPESCQVSMADGFIPLQQINKDVKSKIGLTDDLGYFPRRILYRLNPTSDPDYSRLIKDEFLADLRLNYELHNRYIKNFESYRLTSEKAEAKSVALILMKVTIQFVDCYDNLPLAYMGLKQFQRTGEIDLSSFKAFRRYVRIIRSHGLFQGILLSK